MRTAAITQPGGIGITTVDDPAPGPREVVVEVPACGLCGTDLHILQGELAPKLPIVPGHEFAGEVVAVGTAVTELTVGAGVAVDPSLYCFECHYCRIGRNNLCERWAAVGVTHPGAAAEFEAAPVANCAVLRPSRTPSAGSPRAAPTCSRGVADYAATATTEPYRIYNQEITITGSMAVRHSFERAADLFATGVIDPDLFISDRFPLTALPDAITRFQAGIGRRIQIPPGLADV